jgi:hypothetical protein
MLIPSVFDDDMSMPIQNGGHRAIMGADVASKWAIVGIDLGQFGGGKKSLKFDRKTDGLN